MTALPENSSLSALRALRDDVSERLLRDSPDFRTYRALSDAIMLLEAENDPSARAPPPRRRGRKPILARRAMGILPPGPVVSQREAAEQALMARKIPLPIKELLAEIGARGAIVGGVRPQATLSSNLSQDPRFVLVTFAGRPCWWLSDSPPPPEPTDGEPLGPDHGQASIHA